jgi:hypothetical protein
MHMIIVLAALTALSAGGIALAETRDRPRRRAERLAQAS